MAKVAFIQIYGERNSGTNYLHFLLEENIRNVKVGYKFGWKHGFAKMDKIKEQINGGDLILCMFKDPYSWIVSMHGKPHHAPQLYKLPFDQFIRSEWVCYTGDNYDIRDLKNDPVLADQEMMHERNPDTGERFANVIALRTAKCKRFLELKEEFPNQVRILKYEDYLMKPRISVCDLAGKGKLRLKGPVKVSKGYFGKNPKKKFDRKDYYENREYFKLYSEEDLQYVNQYLDKEVEEKIGYNLYDTKPLIYSLE